MESDTNKQSSLLARVMEGMRRSGYSENYAHAAQVHLKAVSKGMFDDNGVFETRRDLCNCLLSKLFMDNLNMFPVTKPQPQMNNYDCPVPLLPLELFGAKFKPDHMKKIFFHGLNIGDVLDCIVILIDSHGYQLKVIHKYGSTRILENLNITVSLPRTVMSLYQNNFYLGDLIRVAVFAVLKEDRYVQVTLNESVLKINGNNVKLGRISKAVLPSYFVNPPDVSKFKTFAEYLKSDLKFSNPYLLEKIVSGLGIDTRKTSSFYPKFDSECGRQKSSNDMKVQVLENYLNEAVKESNKGNHLTALNLIEEALEIDPKYAKSYEVSGKIYLDVSKPYLNQKSLLDFEVCYFLDPNNENAKQHIAIALSRAALNFYKSKNYKKAIDAANKALKMDEYSTEAFKLLLYLESKHPECFENVVERLKGLKIEKE